MKDYSNIISPNYRNYQCVKFEKYCYLLTILNQFDEKCKKISLLQGCLAGNSAL